MKTVKYIIRIAILCTISCTDLNEKIFSEITTDNYYQTKDDIYAALTRNYVHAFGMLTGSTYLLQEVTADQLIIPTRGRHGYNGGEYVRLHEHKWTVQENFIYDAWSRLFTGVALCNNFIADFEALDFSSFGLDSNTKLRYIAEIRGLRAWYYLFLIDFFRHVPLVTDISEVKGQSTPQEIFDFIETELKEILTQLPQEAGQSRLQQAAIAGFLVRLYLNAEKWTGTARFDDCAQIAREIIDGKYGIYRLDTDYRGPFRCGINGYQSEENLYQFDVRKNYLEASWLYNMWQHYQARYTLDNDWGGWNGGNIAPSRDLEGKLYSDKLGMTFEKFPDEDIRKQPFRITSVNGDYEGFFLIGTQYHFDYEKGYGYTNEIVTGTEEYNGLPLVYVDQVGRFSEGEAGLKGSRLIYGEENTGYRLMKYPFLPQSKNLFLMNALPEVRLAEIYYSLAECKYREGNKIEAAQLLDMVRKRYYKPEDWPKFSYEQNSAKLTDDELIDEWGREFVGERRRRMDLIRWNLFSTANWWDKIPDQSNQDVFPIPERILNSNPLIQQTTPGF
jgi:hypothetical protein